MATESKQNVAQMVQKSSRKLTSFKPKSSKKIAFSENRHRGWRKVREMVPRIIEYGHRTGRLSRTTSQKSMQEKDDQMETMPYRGRNRSESTRYDELALDDDLKHQAIPYLPLPVAICCFVMNLLVPGSGSIASGILGLCIGRPRIVSAEFRRAGACCVNCSMGICQFITVPLFMVGWGWSIAWGGLLVHYALQYRALQQEQRQAIHTINAVEFLSKEKVLHRSNVNNFVRDNKQQRKSNAAESLRR